MWCGSIISVVSVLVSKQYGSVFGPWARPGLGLIPRSIMNTSYFRLCYLRLLIYKILPIVSVSDACGDKKKIYLSRTEHSRHSTFMKS